jgi:hypothetical protein
MNSHKDGAGWTGIGPALCACTSRTSAIQPDPVVVNICQQPTAEMLDIPAMPAAPAADSLPGNPRPQQRLRRMVPAHPQQTEHHPPALR